MAKEDLYFTKEYDRFHFGAENRKINEKHVSRLMESIRKNDMTRDIPILVTKNVEPEGTMTIFDGQHRFEACKRLNKQIYYKFITVHDPEGMVDVNLNVMRWSLEDFVHYYAAQGYSSCRNIIDDAKKFNLPITQMVNVALGHHAGAKSKTMNRLIAGNYDGEERAKVWHFMEMLEVFNRYRFYKQGRFVEAFRYCFKHPSYKQAIMAAQIERYPNLLTSHTSREGFLQGLEYLYNYKRLMTERVFFSQSKYRTENDSE